MAEATTNAKVGKPDTYILGIYITLLVISVVESYSASSREIKNDLNQWSDSLRILPSVW